MSHPGQLLSLGLVHSGALGSATTDPDRLTGGNLNQTSMPWNPIGRGSCLCAWGRGHPLAQLHAVEEPAIRRLIRCTFPVGIIPRREPFSHPPRPMNKIYRGPATTAFTISNDGTAYARTCGLFLSSNAAALSASLLEASANLGAKGLVISMEGVAFAMPQMTPQHYQYVPPELKSIPVALIVNGEQAVFLQSVQKVAASAGTLRSIFRSQQDAERWVKEHAQALDANRVWWARSRV